MLRPGHTIALCVLALLTIGVVMVNSAGMSVRLVGLADAQDPGITPQSIIFSRSTAYMALALGALAVGAFMPIRLIADRLGPKDGHATIPTVRMLTLCVLAMLLVCGLVYVPGIGQERNGSHRWIGLPFKAGGLGEALTMQPSEIAKWGMVALMAWYGTARASVMSRFFAGLLPALLALGVVSGFVVLEDLGTGVLIAATAAVMLLASGARLWQFLMFVPLALLGLVFAILKNPYRIDRITAFLNPYADPEKTGYHMIQSLRAVADGEGFGRGLGHGLQKMGYLPEDRTDFIFAVICEELGVAGAAVVIALFATLLWAASIVAAREPSRLLRLFTLGAMTTVGLQAVINLAVVTGLAPTKGIALPLLSSGGTGWIVTGFSMGLLVAIDRAQDSPEPTTLAAPPSSAPAVT